MQVWLIDPDWWVPDEQLNPVQPPGIGVFVGVLGLTVGVGEGPEQEQLLPQVAQE